MSPLRSSRPRGAHTSGRFARVSVVLVATVVLIVGALGWWVLFADSTQVPKGRPVQVRIGGGQSTRQIARVLAQVGVIGNTTAFILQARLSGADGRLQPGDYDLKTGMPPGEVIRVLRAGPPVKFVTVTIPEGYRLDQIADRMHRDAGVSKKEFIALAGSGAERFSDTYPFVAGAYKGSLEGYLFPKTYRVARGATAKSVIEMMLDQFGRETAYLDYSEARSRGLTPAQVVVIASMIERESKLARERPLVSAVIYNRLRKNMRLKIDATIEYVLRDRKLRLTNADLYTQTPYNTYLHEGLPPGPISNPGLASLQAAAHPADSDFIYYVLTGRDGSHTFTTNLADFLVAKRRSKEVFGR